MKEGMTVRIDANRYVRRSEVRAMNFRQIERRSGVQLATIEKLEDEKSAATNTDGCWIDLFEKPWFGGRLRRLRGPAEFNEANLEGAEPGSMILGPDALVMQIDQKSLAGFRPRQIIPELDKLSIAGKLKAFHLQRAGKQSE